MSNITVKFIGKEYTVPKDILTYIDLLDFTDNIQKRLANAFVRKLKSEISKGNVACLDDKVMAPDIEQQVGKFIAKLTEHGIYDRTINDYLRENEGYKLISKVNAAALDEAKRVFQQQISDWIEGYEDAIQKKDASVTGLSFSILSGSFVNHAIYAAMEASKVNEQEKAAAKEYQKDMAELDARLASRKNEAEKQYVANTYIPHMEAAITVFSYELLDMFISDLIKCGKLNKDLLNYVHIDRSNDLLKNLELSQNKEAVLLKAFEACPYNVAVYMQAMKYDLLDYDSFLAATSFKQGDKILAFLKESIGVADYPKYDEPNIHSATLLSYYTNKSVEEVLVEHTACYANAVVNEYAKIVKVLNNQERCYSFLKLAKENDILAGESFSKRLASSLVKQIIPSAIWDSLVDQCGHADLFDKILRLLPSENEINDKVEYDDYLTKSLFATLENVRKDVAHKIIEQKAQAEFERQKIEEEKRKKRIKTTVIGGIIVALVIIAISLPSMIENGKKLKRENFIEKQIQEIVLPMENKMEDKIHADVTIDYEFSLENDWGDYEQWFEWTFCVRLPMLEDYRKSDRKTDQALLNIMDACEILNEIYDDTLDDISLVDFRNDGVRIVLDYSGGGSLKIRDLSSHETFYYEEYGGKRYLHSSNTEYVIDANMKSEGNTLDSTENSSDIFSISKEHIEYASTILGCEFDSSGKISLSEKKGNFINGSVSLFGELGHFKLGAYSEGKEQFKIDTLDWNSDSKVIDFSKITEALQELYGKPFYINDVQDSFAWINVGMYEEVLCCQNDDGTVTIRWTISL